jgi:hypothetical protein
MREPSTYPRQPRRFNCLRCGCDAYRPEMDRFEAQICFNCWDGKVRG